MKRLFILIALLCLYTAAHAQTPGFTTVRNIPYLWVDGAWMVMDVDIPFNQGPGPFPAIISVHGGGYYGGGRQGTGGRNEVYRGYVVARPDYRLSNTWKFPAPVHDLKAVVRYLRHNHLTYRINPDKIGVWGQSAGGHLALLLGVSGGDFYLEGIRGHLGVDSRVQAVVDVTGPTDFMTLNDSACAEDYELPTSIYSRFMAWDASFTTVLNVVERSRVARYISADDPPIWILHGMQDCTVPFSQSQELYDALVARGASVEFMAIDNAAHSLQPYLRTDTRASVEAFLDRHLKD